VVPASGTVWAGGSGSRCSSPGRGAGASAGAVAPAPSSSSTPTARSASCSPRSSSASGPPGCSRSSRRCETVTLPGEFSGRRFGGADDGAVHARDGLVGEHDLDVDEPHGGQPVEVLRAGQRPGDTPDIGPALGALLGGEVVLGDHVGDPDPPTGG